MLHKDCPIEVPGSSSETGSDITELGEDTSTIFRLTITALATYSNIVFSAVVLCKKSKVTYHIKDFSQLRGKTTNFVINNLFY